MNFLKSLLRRPLAWAGRACSTALSKENDRLKAAMRKLRVEITGHNERNRSDSDHIGQLESQKKRSEDTIDQLHSQIMQLEREKADLEVDVEKLQNTQLINELEITLLTEKVQKYIELNRLERISAQIESNCLTQQGKHNGIDQSEQYYRERAAPAAMEAR